MGVIELDNTCPGSAVGVQGPELSGRRSAFSDQEGRSCGYPTEHGLWLTAIRQSSGDGKELGCAGFDRAEVLGPGGSKRKGPAMASPSDSGFISSLRGGVGYCKGNRQGSETEVMGGERLRQIEKVTLDLP